MHLTVGLLLMFIAWRRANWKNLNSFYPTLIYVVALNLFYNFFALSHFYLWQFSSYDFFFDSSKGVVLWHTLIVNPLFTLIYLSNFPEGTILKKALYLLKFIVIFIVCEWLFLKFEKIHYYNGWNLRCTILFDFMMFSLIRLHYLKPLKAFVITVFCALFYLFFFGYI